MSILDMLFVLLGILLVVYIITLYVIKSTLNKMNNKQMLWDKAVENELVPEGVAFEEVSEETLQELLQDNEISFELAEEETEEEEAETTEDDESETEELKEEAANVEEEAEEETKQQEADPSEKVAPETESEESEDLFGVIRNEETGRLAIWQYQEGISDTYAFSGTEQECTEWVNENQSEETEPEEDAETDERKEVMAHHRARIQEVMDEIKDEANNRSESFKQRLMVANRKLGAAQNVLR